MKTSKMIRWAIACGVAMLSVVSVASDIAVGKWERYTFNGDTPAIGAGEGLFLNGGEASLSFASDGTLTLPIGNMFMFGCPSVGVRSGVLQLTASSTPDLVENPPAELQKAALWLDVGKNLQTEVIGGNTCVTAWYDARESTAAASSYGYAAVEIASSDGPVVFVADGKTSVAFRGYVPNTKRSFMLKDSGGGGKSYAIRHAFMVMNVPANSHTAPVLGNTSTANFFTNPTGDHHAMLANNGVANPVAYSSDYLVDGVYSDPTAAVVGGRHLHEFTLPPNKILSVDSIMRDRNLASGGYRIHEMLLFTEPLTVVERMRISQYLRAKWECGDSRITVDTAPGATVEVASDVSLDSVAVSGEGVLAIGSGVSGSAAHLYFDGVNSRASYSLKDSTSSIGLQASEYEYRLSPGENLGVASSTMLSTLTKTSSTPNGNASVVSERNFIVSELDPAITNLTLSGGGDLVLRAPLSKGSAYEAGMESSATFASTSLSIPAGNAGTETSVVVPIAGDWEIDFDMSNGFSASSGAGVAYYRVYLMSGDSVVWEKNPTVVAPSTYNGANQHRRYLVRNLAAGTYTFRAAGKASTAVAASLSGLAMTYVPNPAHEKVVPVTDGDFESSRFEYVFHASSKNNVGSRTQWALTNGELSETQDPAVQTVVSSAMGYSGSYDYMFRSSQLGRYGDNALVWYHNNSTATSPQTTLPAGTWKLRLDAVRWTTGTTGHSKVGTGDAGRCNNPATLTASVTVNDGEPVSLGEIGPISNFTAVQLTFPATFDVSEGDSVKVILGQTTAKAAVQIDNLELVKVDGGTASSLGAELVAGGSVETADDISKWTLDDYTPAGGVRHVVQVRSPVDTAFGATRCDGTNVFRNANGGRAYQSISFPAGVFKLSWWSRARVQNGSIVYSSPVTFWYAASGAGTTNVIVRSEMSWCTNFLEHIAYFSVPTAGNYVFGFNSDDADRKDVLVDCVSVRQVLGSEATPDIPEHTEIKVSGGGKLRLDYNGCLKLGRLRVNGKSFMGEVSAERYPDYISGPGRALVKERGFVLTFR